MIQIALTNPAAPAAAPVGGAVRVYDEPVPALSRHALGAHYRYWRGASGKRYLHRVYAFSQWPSFELANIMFVRKDAGGIRHILWIGQTGTLAGLPRECGILARAAALGANEVHVHLLGETPAQRDAAEHDLKAARPPANAQAAAA